jgi:hypothetical protein
MTDPFYKLRLAVLATAALSAGVHTAGAETADPLTIAPIQAGENVLFIGNSLTAKLPEQINEQLLKQGWDQQHGFNGHRHQWWAETFETHWLIDHEDPAYTDKFITPNGRPEQQGMFNSGYSSLWKQGQYNVAQYVDRIEPGEGYLKAQEIIRNGTPDGQAWDRVILQSYAGQDTANQITGSSDDLTFSGPTFAYGKKLVDLVREQGAQPILYAPWLSDPTLYGGIHNDKNWAYPVVFQRQIDNNRKLAEALDMPMIPIGEILRRLTENDRPAAVDQHFASLAVNLDDDDRNDLPPETWLIRDTVHASAPGQAMLLYAMTAALTGIDPHEIDYSHISQNQWDRGDHYVQGEAENKYGLLITPELDQAIKTVVEEELTRVGILVPEPASAAVLGVGLLTLLPRLSR